jgi:uncharacterized membrane protein (DUF106 family)
MFEFLFNWLLVFNPVISVTIFSIIMIIVINIFYRVLIKQDEAKRVKDNIKELTEKSKQERKAGNMDKSMQYTKEAMSENSKVMRMTMKPMLVSFVVVILFLPFLSAVYGDHLVALNNNAGNFTFNENVYDIVKDGSNLKISGNDCASPCMQKIDNIDWKITSENNNVKFARVLVMLPIALPIFGAYIGWLGWYILVSIPVMIVIRKLLKINL